MPMPNAEIRIMIDALYKIEARAKQLLDATTGPLALNQSDLERATRCAQGREDAIKIKEAAVRLLKILEK